MKILLESFSSNSTDPTNHFAVPRSAEPIRCHIRANNELIGRLLATVTAVLLTVSKYSRVTREKKFQYRSTGSRGTEISYKQTRDEDSQVRYFDIYLYASRGKVNNFTNEQYCWSLVYSQNGGDPKQDFIRHKQRYCNCLPLNSIIITAEYIPGVLN